MKGVNKIAWFNKSVISFLLVCALGWLFNDITELKIGHGLLFIGLMFFFFAEWVSRTLCDFMDAIVSGELRQAKAEVYLEEILEKLDK